MSSVFNKTFVSNIAGMFLLNSGLLLYFFLDVRLYVFIGVSPAAKTAKFRYTP